MLALQPCNVSSERSVLLSMGDRWKLRHKGLKWLLASLAAVWSRFRCKAFQLQVCASPLVTGPAGRDEYGEFCHPNSSTICQLLPSKQGWWVTGSGACVTFHYHCSGSVTCTGCLGRTDDTNNQCRIAWCFLSRDLDESQKVHSQFLSNHKDILPSPCVSLTCFGSCHIFLTWNKHI